ncbi:hypothetical protein ABPG77_000110 [Micractinium sp. CCAP 211/92]
MPSSPRRRQTIVELAASLLGVQPRDLEAPDARLLSQLLLSPSEQVRELQSALSILVGGGGSGDPAAARQQTAEMTAQVGAGAGRRRHQRLGRGRDWWAGRAARGSTRVHPAQTKRLRCKCLCCLFWVPHACSLFSALCLFRL